VGGRGASSLSAGKSGSVFGYVSQTKTKVDEISNKDVREFLENRTASDFISVPATVTVKGVEFQYFTKTESYNGRRKEHFLHYQSSEQNSKGEWPLLEICITEHKRQKSTYYTFRYGGTGSRIK